MMEKSMNGALIAALSGILGVVIGAIVSGLMNAHIQEEERRARAVLESFQFDQMQYPVEFLSLKQLVEEMRSLSIMSSTAVRRLAEVHRIHPGCANALSNACRPALVKTIEVLRDELGSGQVRSEDIELLLSSKHEAAMRAFEKFENR